MATPDRPAFQRMLERAGRALPDPTWVDAEDLGRLSVEASVSRTDEVRDRSSTGQLRLHGAAVAQHKASLEDVGWVAAQWQRCVSAIGAALEGSRGTVGRLPLAVLLRTRLMLDAAPAAGSVVLSLTPNSDPSIETAPGGQREFFEPRPLADRASSVLIQLLRSAADAPLDSAALGQQFVDLGPRVASAIRTLAQALVAAGFDVDARWEEPQRPAETASFTVSTAVWLEQFVGGRALDSYLEWVTGTVRTVSDLSKWVIETADSGMMAVDATQLDQDIVRSVTIGQLVSMTMRVQRTDRPDGSWSARRTAVELQFRQHPER